MSEALNSARKRARLSFFAALLLYPLLTFAADQPTLTELDHVIMRPPPFPRTWETNLTSLAGMAQKGDADAQFNLGVHCIYALGTPQNLPAAVELLKRSANQKFPPAEYTLGVLYKYGVGVSSNRATADEWFQKAADQGYTPAKHEAAIIADRKGNRAEALRLLREAADKGFPSSQYLMGCVVSNPVESYVWHSLAAPNVELASTRSLELRQTLTKEQLAEAENRIRDFQEKRAIQTPAKR